ncbi:MAG TPA: MarR family transcriptional regulator [Chitinophagaceae bacterium]|nr:MarR family transcriptional regulator [Chitinophagaceae bacterium]
MNAIEQAGILAISTRLLRLSEQLRREGVQIYKEYGIAFEPKWFPVIYTLHIKPLLSVVEIADEIGYSHPSAISLLKEMEKEKLVQSKKDKTDERKRLVQLTVKGSKLVAQMKPVWDVMTKAIAELTCNKNDLMEAIIETEVQLRQQNFYQRALRIETEQSAR